MPSKRYHRQAYSCWYDITRYIISLMALERKLSSRNDSMSQLATAFKQQSARANIDLFAFKQMIQQPSEHLP
ncbi:DUF489 family protein [Vibrio chagasii]|nr:DUF489 family protein [Vibrio chagasii]